MHHWFVYPTNISPIAFHLGPIAVHWYGIAYLLGFVAVYLWMSRPAGRTRLGLTSDQIQDFMFYALIGVLVGGRTLFVIADILTRMQHHNDPGIYFAHPINLIAVWNGGMAFHGGLIGVIIGVFLFLRKHPALTFTVLGDEIVMLLPLGIGITRIVNFINDELWGRVCDPSNPICMIFPADPSGQYRFPSQLFESAMDLATLPILFLIYRMKPRDGVVAWSWVTVYGITRTIAEVFRAPGLWFMGLHDGQLLAVPQIVIGLIGLWYCLRHGSHTDATPAS